MIPRPPTSNLLDTPVPYTTLLRSRPARESKGGRTATTREHDGARHRAGGLRRLRRGAMDHAGPGRDAPGLPAPRRRGPGADHAREGLRLLAQGRAGTAP